MLYMVPWRILIFAPQKIEMKLQTSEKWIRKAAVDVMNGELERMRQLKAQLRARMSRIRGSIPPERHVSLSGRACGHAAAWLIGEQIRSMLIYVPFRSELDTKPLVEEAWRAGIDVYVPRCLPEDRSMTIHLLQQWDELKTGAYGIMEPDPRRRPAEADDFVPEAVIMPGLAFDLNGGRLGYGGGYYDRLHERFSAGGKRRGPRWAGIGFGGQVVEQVPMETTDARLQVLITEQGVRKMNGEAEDGTDAF